ncbi:MAG: ABC transporter permease [Atopobiaceae bacterium]|jgi:peptide/nickel transport system permease protein|nr:ABC transporter permease [Atopobiaceae bacterium]
MARFIWYITKRILSYIVMIFVATSLTYFLACAFMSPRSNFESKTPRPPQDSIEASLDRTNLNDKTPVLERYQRWLGGILTQWDWGMSPDGDSVNSQIAGRISASVELMTLATVLSIAIGVSLGVYTAQRQYLWQDRFWSGLASVFMVIPTVVLAILVVFFAIEINQQTGARVFYVTGLSSYTGDNMFLAFIDFLQHILLPTIVPHNHLGGRLPPESSVRTSWMRCTPTMCARHVPRASRRSRPSGSMPCALLLSLPR